MAKRCSPNGIMETDAVLAHYPPAKIVQTQTQILESKYPLYNYKMLVNVTFTTTVQCLDRINKRCWCDSPR